VIVKGSGFEARSQGGGRPALAVPSSASKLAWQVRWKPIYSPIFERPGGAVVWRWHVSPDVTVTPDPQPTRVASVLEKDSFLERIGREKGHELLSRRTRGGRSSNDEGWVFGDPAVP